MANLEVKTKMSPLQLAIIVVTAMVGMPGQTLAPVLKAAGHAAWLSIIVGTVVYYGMAWLMVKLGEAFPDESFAEYLPRIFGRWPGGAVVWLFVLIFFLQYGNVLHVMSREITFFMFDQTPFEVVAIGLLTVCAYCALQDWGTILRVMQFIFFTAFPGWLFLLLVSLLSFRFINFLPLWPEDAAGVAAGVMHSWSLFQGYECVLLLLPLVYKGNIKPARTVAAALALNTGVFLLWAVLQIGALTLEGAKNTPFPIMTVIRNVEIPGTFLERLDTYFLLFWIQLVFASITLAIYFMAQSLTLLYRYADHRPFVLALVPLFFLLGDASHHIRVQEAVKLAAEWTGLPFSLGVIPLIYAFVWWRRRQRRGQGTITKL
ncbi:MAG TPA: endospore germination permease [Negativicutes bacterium]|nr:endospore germination permease [Negativicutes bacterium]